MKKPWVLVFDWDGTLVETLEIKIRNAGELFGQAFGIDPVLVETAYRHHSGLPRRQMFKAIGEELGLPPIHEDTYRALSQAFSERNRAAFSRLSREQLLRQDTLTTLESLSGLGYPLFVSSAADPNEVRQIAGSLGIDHFFTEILGSEPGFYKGADHLNYIQKKCNARPSQIVFIGDEPTDILLGRQAGTLTVAKVGTYPAERLTAEGAHGVINTLGEFIPWLDQVEITEA